MVADPNKNPRNAARILKIWQLNQRLDCTLGMKPPVATLVYCICHGCSWTVFAVQSDG